MCLVMQIGLVAHVKCGSTVSALKRKYHLIREIVMKGVVVVEKITFAENLADPFMKTLSTGL